ncbi:DUF1643 domain-containing protein [Bhargavaea beijingensis]|uniref:DUF1643 domain-containing protein n=1 Tax=Bhargavaea beijingensis TaxID=426756 RepID=UPI002224C19D|nr:DUF1643 domain-containing protein [Bhargavaea beijingensis]MCW1927365.1 DUF1643 domain-containing protein [Bhargavaea beijingensis]
MAVQEQNLMVVHGQWDNGKRTTQAIFDPSEKHRYRLSVSWEENLPSCLYIMLNPSTADAIKPDPTLRKCVGFAERNGFGSLEVLNLYSYRATKPADLWKSGELRHPDNDIHLKEAISGADKIIVSWGIHGRRNRRYQDILEYIQEAGKVPYCLGKTKCGMPRHPLMLAYATQLIEYVY